MHLACPLPAVTRVEETGNPSLRSGARLLVGTLHDNALLLTRSICLETFASPLLVRTRTLSSGRGTVGPLQVGGQLCLDSVCGLPACLAHGVAASSLYSSNSQGEPDASRGVRCCRW